MSNSIYGVVESSRKVKKLYGVNTSKYRMLDYIEATGTQWIDTGFTPDNNSRMVLDFAATDITTNTNNIIGSRKTASSTVFSFSTIGGKWRMGYNNASTNTGVAADTDRHTADMNKNVLYLDGTAIYTATAAEFTGAASIYIGAIHASSTGYVGYAKIYSCQIYDNDVLVRNLIPCIDPSGEIGMLDTVNGVFYASAGTDVFVAGSETGETYTFSGTRKAKKGYIAVDGVTRQFYGVSTILNNNDWATISEISDADQGANFWAVGDAKQVNINGKIGNTTFTDVTLWAFIIGFNHNSSVEGEHRIHFQLGRSEQGGGNNVCLIGSVYSAYSSKSGAFAMNPASSATASSNSGGWKSSKMRTVVLGSNTAPTSPKSNSYVAALPSELRSVMKSMTKYSDNTGGGYDVESYVTATTDYLPLLSAYEVNGKLSTSYGAANSAEINYQQQYAYYKNGNSKLIYSYSDLTDVVIWYLRSVEVSNAMSFCYMNWNTIMSAQAGYCMGVVPVFCV